MKPTDKQYEQVMTLLGACKYTGTCKHDDDSINIDGIYLSVQLTSRQVPTIHGTKEYQSVEWVVEALIPVYSAHRDEPDTADDVLLGKFWSVEGAVKCALMNAYEQRIDYAIEGVQMQWDREREQGLEAYEAMREARQEP